MFIKKLFGMTTATSAHPDTGDLRDSIGMDLSNAVSRDADRRQRAKTNSTTSLPFSGFDAPFSPSTATAGQKSTVPLLGKVRSSAHAQTVSSKENIIYGPQDEQGRFQRWACKYMTKKSEVKAYKDTRAEIIGTDRVWTQWTTEEHSWVAVPKLNCPRWKDKIPFLGSMPPIFTHHHHVVYDHSHRRVDRLLDEVVAEAKTINFSRKRSRSTEEEDRPSLPREIYNLVKESKRAKK